MFSCGSEFSIGTGRKSDVGFVNRTAPALAPKKKGTKGAAAPILRAGIEMKWIPIGPSGAKKFRKGLRLLRRAKKCDSPDKPAECQAPAHHTGHIFAALIASLRR